MLAWLINSIILKFSVYYSTQTTFSLIFLWPQNRGVYIGKFNPPLFARLSLPQTKIGSKQSERVVWAQNKAHFWTQAPLKTPWLTLFMNSIFLNFFIFWSYRLIGGQLASSRALRVVIYAPASEIEQWKVSISIHIIINVRPSFFYTKAFVYKSLTICPSMIKLFHHTV